MSERDRGMAIALLAEAFNLKDLSAAKIRIYDQALQKVPQACLEPMVQRAIATRTFFPKVAELLADAEYARVQLLGTLRYEACEQCDGTGWVSIEEHFVRRCWCWIAHLQKVKALNVGHEPLALTAGEME